MSKDEGLQNDEELQSGDVYVNEDCIGCWVCAAMSPDVFELNDEGIAEAKIGVGKSDEVDDVVWVCPVGAINYKE